MPTYFDSLLESLDPDAKTQFTGLVEKAPAIKDTLDQASRYMEWASNNWDAEHQMTKSEYVQSQTIRNLEAQIAMGGEVTLEDLNAKLDGFMNERKLVTSDVLQTDKAYVEKLIGKMSEVSTRVPYLNAKYKDEFGEYFDPDEFLKAANANPSVPLDKFYETDFIAGKRTAAAEKKFQDAVARAKDEGIREGMQRKVEGGPSNSPTLDGSPVMSAFQQKIMGMQNGAGEGDRSNVPPDAQLGQGVISRAAALAGDRKELGAWRGSTQ
jgi:hypothetical protein